MRHSYSKYKLTLQNRDRSSLISSLARALILSEKDYIETTIIKAKALRPFFEKLITLGKKDTLHSKRRIISLMKGCGDAADLSAKFAQKAKSYSSREGGYTRIVRNGYRSGDNAPMAIIQLV